VVHGLKAGGVLYIIVVGLPTFVVIVVGWKTMYEVAHIELSEFRVFVTQSLDGT
jgi:hypothetical protein